jgi:hypothetical protein
MEVSEMENRKYFGKWIIWALVAAALYSITSNAFAGPALYWWHTTVGVSQSECAKRAEKAMVVERIPVKDKGNYYVTGYHDNITTTVKCLKCNGKTMAIIISTGQDGQYTKDIMEKIRNGVQKGVIGG